MSSELTPAQLTARRRALTQREARTKVTAELRARGYAASENRRGLLTVRSPSGYEFRVAVNGQIGKGAWLTVTRPEENLFYVLVYLPSEGSAEFFILTKADQDAQNHRYQKQHPRNRNKTGGGFGWEDALEFSGCWDKLPK